MTFRIVHTGYLHTDIGIQQQRQAAVRRVVGGATGDVDILTRSHVHVLAAIERLARDPELAGKIELYLAGVLSKSDREVAERSPLVRAAGTSRTAETIQMMRSADLLFLPMQDLPPGKRSDDRPGKTYEYLASGRPILAAVPEGDARDIILQAGAGYACDPKDSDAMAKIIADEFEPARTEHRLWTSSTASTTGNSLATSRR